MIEIDQENCIGCGSCVASAGEVYEMRSDGRAHVKEGIEDVEGEKLEQAKKGADVCPVDVIDVS